MKFTVRLEEVVSVYGEVRSEARGVVSVHSEVNSEARGGGLGSE